MATPQVGASTNGGDEVPRSASSGKVSEDADSSSKRKRRANPPDASNVSDPVSTRSSSGGQREMSGPAGPAVTGKSGPLAKRRKGIKPDSDSINDMYCWVCHKELHIGQVSGFCKTCPRSYHARCIPGMKLAVVNELPVHNSGNWSCPECCTIEQAENILTRSPAMQILTLDDKSTLFKFALDRMKTINGAEPFLKPVDPAEVPEYKYFVVNPMDLSLLERKVRGKHYGSTEAFLADAKWILHNSAIFNTRQSKQTSVARAIVKACRQELTEIENCPDCYSRAHTRKETWFTEVCRRPHILVWAKLKGFPFWPAKAMKVNKESAVDVRFFGAHNRAWVPVGDCFLYSKEMPARVKQKKKGNLDNSIIEAEQHVQSLKEKYGAFSHAPPRTPFDPEQWKAQLKMLLPNDSINDVYCWVCHEEPGTEQVFVFCTTCPRSYHAWCIPGMKLALVNELPEHNSGNYWCCPECKTMVQAEYVPNRSDSMVLCSLKQLGTFFKFALDRMKNVYGAEAFLKPVDPAEVPNYAKFVVNPMDLSLLERNIRSEPYGSPEAFLADAKWILHNSAIFNTWESEQTSAARAIVNACRQEMTEIENCPDCYSNAHTRKESWFTEVCRRPHILVWAKVEGFPYFPAKAMKVNKESAVDVRFFGAHDRAWVPVGDCFLYSKEMPADVEQEKKGNLDNCIAEAEQHAQRLKERYGGVFSHAPPRTPFKPAQREAQLKMLLPNYKPVDYRALYLSSRRAQTGASSSSGPATATSSQVEDAPDQNNKPLLFIIEKEEEDDYRQEEQLQQEEDEDELAPQYDPHLRTLV